MEITNPALPVLLGLAALVLLVLLALGLPRMHRRSTATAVRAGQAIVMNLAALMCAGLVLNNQYLFYVSWSDLLGPSNVQAQQLTRGAGNRGANVRIAPVVTEHSSFPSLPTPNSLEQQYTVHGTKSGVDASVIVILPKGYSTRPARRYPVLEMMTGYPGVPRSAFRAFDLRGSWSDLVDAHEIAAPIVVIPQINTPDNIVDTECVDDPTGRLPKTETWLADDLPQWIAQHFPVSNQRDHWATIGYSYGGWCAAMLAMRHPATFGGGASLMGYFSPQFGSNYNPFKIDPAAGRAYQLGLLAHTRPPATSLLVMASKNDPESYPYMVQFLKQVRSPMAVTSLVLASGGHNVDEIPLHLPQIMAWLSKSLAGFRYQP